MTNILYINNVKIVQVVNIDKRSKGFLLEDGTTYPNISKPIAGLEIECQDCHSRHAIKSIHRDGGGYLVKPYVCLSCHAAGENNPFYGKKHPEEFKRRLSQERKGKWYLGEQNPMYGKTNLDVWTEKFGEEKASELDRQRLEKIGEQVSGEKNYFYGKHHTEETKRKIATSSKRFWDNMSGEYKEKLIARQQASLKEYAQANPEDYRASKVRASRKSHIVQSGQCRMNQVEQIVGDYLESHFPDAFKFSVVLGFYQFDFGHKERKILIEVHGDYWHCNPAIYDAPKNKTQRDKIARDQLKIAFAAKHDFHLFTIWEREARAGDFSSLKGIHDLMKSLPAEAK